MPSAQVNSASGPTALPMQERAGGRVWAFVALTYAISWTIWIGAIKLGAGVGAGEYVLAFGSAGPALAAMLLSRSRTKSSDVSLRSYLTFAVVSLLAWQIYHLNDELRGIHATARWYVFIIAMLGLLPAWILSGGLSGDTGIRRLLSTFTHPNDFRWPAIAFLFFPTFLLIPAEIVHLLGGALVWPAHRDSSSSVLTFPTVFFLNSFLFAAVLEEPGWRGFLLPRLQDRFSPLITTLLVWVPWSLWHLPLDLSGSIARDWMYYLQVRIVFGLAMALILTWLYNRSGGNLLAIAIFHAGMNSFPFILPYSPKSLPLLLLFAVVVIFTDRMWRRRMPSAIESVQRPGSDAQTQMHQAEREAAEPKRSQPE